MTVHFIGQHSIDDGYRVLFGRFGGTATVVESRHGRVGLLGPGQHDIHVILVGYGKTVIQYFLHLVHVGDAAQQFTVDVDYLVADFNPAVSR